MMPWGHLAVGYLLYSFFARSSYRRPPKDEPTLVLALGTQFPDLIDKPAGYWFGFYDGRAFGHSLLILLPLCAGVLLAARRSNREDLGIAFGIGVLSHLPGDAWHAILSGNTLSEASYLLWPLLPAPTYPTDSFTEHLVHWVDAVQSLRFYSLNELLGSWLMFQLAFVIVLFGIWAIDGFPGIRTAWRLIMPNRS